MPQSSSSQHTGRHSFPARILRFYIDGFRSMTVGRKLWALIIIKLVFIFLIMKLLFFPDILSRDYDNDADRANAVREALIYLKV